LGVFLKNGVWPFPATAMSLRPTISDALQRLCHLIVAVPGDGRTPTNPSADFENTRKLFY
jgi:hypothetical protein